MGTSQRALAVILGWKGNFRSGVASLSVRYPPYGFIGLSRVSPGAISKWASV